MTPLISKIQSKQLTVGVIGMGYVGLPLMLRFAEVGVNTVGFDIDQTKINALNDGLSYIHHIPSDAIKNYIDKKLIKGTSDFSKVSDVDAILICVPTPLSKHREPNISYVENTIDSILPHLRKNQLISLESTTYPGTTEELILTKIEKSTDLIVGENIFVVYSPEREDPGNPDFTTQTIPKVVGGITAYCREAGVSLYSTVIDKVVPVSSTQTAEMVKLLENIHRAVNIGLVNEMKIVADRMNIDIHEVIRAASTKPFGFTPYYPGPGLGGHCIPIDPFYLTWKAREYGLNTRFIELAGEVNTNMPTWVVSKVLDALNEKGKSIKNSKILILGISYKKNIDDMRESPSVEIMELLREKGAILEYHDSLVPEFPKMREHKFDLSSVPLNENTIKNADCVVLTTDHDSVDYDFIKENAKLIVDTRGKYLESNPKIIKA